MPPSKLWSSNPHFKEKKMNRPFTLALVLLAASSAYATTDHDHHKMPPAKTNRTFDQMKQLIGTWEGMTKMGDKETQVTATYEMTSGGNAIIERLFAGTPHEMISIYHPEGNTVAMTHYCMMGNQPKMKVKKSDEKSVTFEMVGNTGLSSPKEMHMHGLNMTWISPTSISQEWTSFDKGKKVDAKVFTLTKK
jgi:hypothetical protein